MESLTKIIYNETRINAMKADSSTLHSPSEESTIKYEERARQKELENECKLCMAGFEVWVSTLNFSSEKEDEMRRKLLGYCPVCKLVGNKVNKDEPR